MRSTQHPQATPTSENTAAFDLKTLALVSLSALALPGIESDLKAQENSGPEPQNSTLVEHNPALSEPTNQSSSPSKVADPIVETKQGNVLLQDSKDTSTISQSSDSSSGIAIPLLVAGGIYLLGRSIIAFGQLRPGFRMQAAASRVRSLANNLFRYDSPVSALDLKGEHSIDGILGDLLLLPISFNPKHKTQLTFTAYSEEMPLTRNSVPEQVFNKMDQEPDFKNRLIRQMESCYPFHEARLSAVHILASYLEHRQFDKKIAEACARAFRIDGDLPLSMEINMGFLNKHTVEGMALILKQTAVSSPEFLTFIEKKIKAYAGNTPQKMLRDPLICLLPEQRLVKFLTDAGIEIEQPKQ